MVQLVPNSLAPPDCDDLVTAAVADPAIWVRMRKSSLFLIRNWFPLLTAAGREQELDEVYSDARARALTRRSTFQPSASIENWLRGIIRNILLERVKAIKRASLVSGNIVELSPDPHPSPWELLERAEAVASVMAALEQLPVWAREVIQLHREGLDGIQIAERLHLSHGTARQRLSRARLALAELLNGHRAEDAS